MTRRTLSFPPSSDEEDDAQSVAAKRLRRDAPALSAADSCNAASAPKQGRRAAESAPSRAHKTRRPGKSTSVIAKPAQQQSRRTLQTRIDAVYKKSAEKAGAEALVEKKKQQPLPHHLEELVALNKAFLETVMIHIAHHGSSSPIDIRLLAPNISRTWGKRQVTVEDIRRCIAIQWHGRPREESPFFVSDHGRGRLCVQIAAHMVGSSVNEARLCRQFQENMRALCAEKAAEKAANQASGVDALVESLSLADLPQAAVKEMGKGMHANPALAKGRRALADLKSGIAAKQQDQEAASKKPFANPDGTKMSLLDRLRHKQLARANEPLPPSGPELQRRAALNRVADVAATISMLSLSHTMSLPRQAFTMLAISEKLQDSLRVPLSREEGMACVRLIATEVAPEWLRIVPIGGRENVVIQRHSQPIDRVIHERVQKLLAV